MDPLLAERMFLAVVDSGSFTAAAARLGTSSGQASKLVARLEARLGLRLLHRTTRTVAPTEAGAAYADRMRPLMAAMADAEDDLRDASASPRGHLRLTAPQSFGTLRLAPLLARFAADWPGISLDVLLTDRVSDLAAEGLDAAIRVGVAPGSTLVGRRLGQTRLVTLAAPAYLAARGTPEVPADLAGHDCLLDTNFRDPRQWQFAEGPVAVAGRVAFSNAEACLAAAEAGLGIACMPDFVPVESLAQGRTLEILSGFAPPPLPIHILFPGGRPPPARLRLLIDRLVQDLRA